MEETERIKLTCHAVIFGYAEKKIDSSMLCFEISLTRNRNIFYSYNNRE